jgi:hypothetical protein
MNRAERRADFLSRHRQSRAGLVNEPANQSTANARNQAGSAAMLDRPRASNVQLHIEELVLNGFAPHDRYLIGDAVQHELARLFTERGVPAHLMDRGRATRLDAGSFSVRAETKTHAIGAQIAGAVYGGGRR